MAPRRKYKKYSRRFRKKSFYKKKWSFYKRKYRKYKKYRRYYKKKRTIRHKPKTMTIWDYGLVASFPKAICLPAPNFLSGPHAFNPSVSQLTNYPSWGQHWDYYKVKKIMLRIRVPGKINGNEFIGPTMNSLIPAARGTYRASDYPCLNYLIDRTGNGAEYTATQIYADQRTKHLHMIPGRQYTICFRPTINIPVYNSSVAQTSYCAHKPMMFSSHFSGCEDVNHYGIYWTFSNTTIDDWRETNVNIEYWVKLKLYSNTIRYPDPWRTMPPQLYVAPIGDDMEKTLEDEQAHDEPQGEEAPKN